MSEIAEIKVKNLFGHLDYNIPLNNADRITIIHGPNGCGKTWILQLISHVFSLNYGAIRSAPFQEIQFAFHDGGLLTVRKEPEERSSPDAELHQPRWVRQPNDRIVFLYESKRTKEPKKFISRLRRGVPASFIQRAIPQLERVGPREWLDHSRDAILTYDRVVDYYGSRLPSGFDTALPNPEWLVGLTKRVNVSFIQSQRLIRMPAARTERTPAPADRDVTTMVDLFSKNLAERIRQTLAESVKIAQSRDQTFPTRLLRGDFSEAASESELREALGEMEEKRQKLYSAGLLDQENPVPLPQKAMTAMEQKVLSLYLGDVRDKLQMFDNLQIRIATLMNLINSKIESQGKSMIVSRDMGILFKTDRSTDKTLLPSQMSSGEQHQLVLFYELLFNAENRYFILIDEPEISLNVGWQRRFISDLIEVIQLGHHYVLMATHSPQIIHNRWDLAVPLSGGVKQ